MGENEETDLWLEERLLEYTEIAVECWVSDICFSLDVGRSMFDVYLSK